MSRRPVTAVPPELARSAIPWVSSFSRTRPRANGLPTGSPRAPLRFAPPARAALPAPTHGSIARRARTARASSARRRRGTAGAARRLPRASPRGRHAAPHTSRAPPRPGRGEAEGGVGASYGEPEGTQTAGGSAVRRQLVFGEPACSAAGSKSP